MPSNPAPTLATTLPDSSQVQDRFGVDIVTYPSLDPNFALLTGIRALAERIYRRFLTPRGFMTFHPGDGLDIRAFLSKGINSRQLASIRGLVEEEAKKDEQVDDADATVDFDEPSESLSIALAITASDSSTFTMTMSVTSLDVTLLHVGASSP